MNNSLFVRNARPSDHARIVAVMPNWWNSHDLTSMLPEIFLMHFNDSSFIAERHGELAGFLIGRMSQTARESRHIHRVRVDPDARKAGVGRQLHEHFFECCLTHERPYAQACTAASNELSIAFHQGLGFEIEPRDETIDGFPVTTDHFGPGDSTVLFKKSLKN